MDKGTAPSPAMVDKLMKLNGYEKRLDDYFADYPLMIALPYLADKDLAEELREKYARPKETHRIYHQVYSKYMTGDEILDLIAFFKSPTGQKFVQHDEQIRAELQAQILKLATEIAVEMVKDSMKQNRPPETDSGIDLNLPEV